MLLRRITIRYAVLTPLFTLAAWLFVTGAFGPPAG